MTRLQQAGLTGCAALLLATMLAAPATARIECRGNFQMNKSGPIATPYCEEEQIAVTRRDGEGPPQLCSFPATLFRLM